MIVPTKPLKGESKEEKGASEHRKVVEDYTGKFQRASVDEAYLEPGKRTLEMELIRSRYEVEEDGGRALGYCSGKDAKGIKRSRREPLQMGSVGLSSGPYSNPDKGGRGMKTTFDACRVGEGSGLLDGDESAPGRSSESAPTDQDSAVRGGSGCRDGDFLNGTRTESDRLLEAGGSLGARIQRTLREALEYDCSIGVAENKVSRCWRWPRYMLRDIVPLHNIFSPLCMCLPTTEFL